MSDFKSDTERMLDLLEDILTATGAPVGGFATQTTLAAVLTKLTADPATQTTLAAILAKLTADPATQTTLAAILAKLTADPATQTTLAAILAVLPNSLPFNADNFICSNPDGNGNYQTIVYKIGAAVVKTITLTFDSSSNVVTYSQA